MNQAKDLLDMPIWTEDKIRALLQDESLRGYKAVTRALMALYARQTQQEQAANTTQERNGEGFTAADAKVLCRMAAELQRRRALIRQPERLLGITETKRVRPLLLKYSRQLLEIAKQKGNSL